jgi:hypothetical protein
MGLLDIFKTKKHLNKIKSKTYTCRWCDYQVFPGEYHEACEILLKKHTCKVCSYPRKPGQIHVTCKEYLRIQIPSYPHCIYCKKVCIPGKPHRDCNFLAMYDNASTCHCCGFKILKGLEHTYCKKITVIQ